MRQHAEPEISSLLVPVVAAQVLLVRMLPVLKVETVVRVDHQQ
jgi:hypothetical protein